MPKADKLDVHEAAETTLRKRTRFLIFFFLLMVFVVIGRLIYIQVYNASFYQAEALSQWHRIKDISPLRGRILDAKEVVLAQSGDAYTVVAQPEKIRARYLDDTAQKLADALGANAVDIRRRLASDASEVTVKRQVTDDQAQTVMDLRLPGIRLTMGRRRNYPLGSLASQVLGYTNYDGVGQMGLEEDYDSELAGIKGKLINDRTASGKELPYGVEQLIPATHGYDLKLTIDVVVQAAASDILNATIAASEAKRGSLIAMDIQTGQVYAMANEPSVDLNSFDRQNMDASRSLLRNSCILDNFQPGTSFGIITAAAMMEAGKVTLDTRFPCTGYLHIDGENVYIDPGHGEETLREALEHDCEVVLGQLALDSNIWDLYSSYEKLGLGAATGVGLESEADGDVLPLKYINQKQLAQIGYGQSIAITPMQFASALSGVLNRGERMQPYLVDQIIQSGEEENVLSQTTPTMVEQVSTSANAQELAALYERKVSQSDGNARNVYIAGYRVGGASSVAPKPSSSYYDKEEYTVNCFAFAPADEPRFLVVVMLDSPRITSMSFARQMASPAARTVLHNILKQKHVKAQYEGDDVGVQINDSIPNVTGRSLEEAKAALSEAGFRSTTNGSGTVLAQIPAAGSKAPSRTGVLLFMTETEELSMEDYKGVTVPNVLGKSLYAAYKELSRWGLETETTGERLGLVIEQTPYAGTIVEPNSSVLLTLKEPETE